MRFGASLILLSAVIVLTGCATLNKNECQSADWEMIGFEDGRNGSPPERMQRHREACAKHGITPDFSEYQQGYDKGIVSFCTRSVGYEKGKVGYQYQGVCPIALEPNFLSGFVQGHEIYTLRQKIVTLDNQIGQRQKDKVTLDADILAVETELAGNNTPELLVLWKDLQTRLAELEAGILQLQLDSAEAKGALTQLEKKSFY